MNKRERLAALKLAALLEEFTPQELARAADALSGAAPLPRAFERLLGNDRKVASKPAPQSRPAHLRESKAVRALKGPEPERYELLASFESRLRTGELLPTTNDLTQFARDVGVDVKARGRRQDIVSQLMARLVDLPAEAAEQIIENVPIEQDSDDSYHRLATYIHRGYDPGPSSRSDGPRDDEAAQTRD